MLPSHLIRLALVQDEDINSTQWTDLVIVAQFMPASIKVNGFAYSSAGKPTPTSPSGVEITKKFQALRQAMIEPGKEPWKACLVRIEQPSGKMSIDFEYDQPEKWLIVPSTVRKMGESLKPVKT